MTHIVITTSAKRGLRQYHRRPQPRDQLGALLLHPSEFPGPIRTHNDPVCRFIDFIYLCLDSISVQNGSRVWSKLLIPHHGDGVPTMGYPAIGFPADRVGQIL